jgi:hypothetical protein
MAGMTQVHIHGRDRIFIGLISLTLAGILGFLFSGFAETGTPAGGWRRIDTERLEMRLESGELQRREAEWYVPLQP